MKLIERWQNLIDHIKSMKRKELESWKYLIFVVIFIDVFGVYWFLKLKGLTIALLLVAIGFLVFILIMESKLPPEPPNPKEINNKPNEKGGKNKMDENKEENLSEEESKEDSGEWGLGLPDSEEYNKRLEKALGIGY